MEKVTRIQFRNATAVLRPASSISAYADVRFSASEADLNP